MLVRTSLTFTFLGEYLYILTKNGLTLRHRTYAINQSEEDLLE